MLSLVIKNFGCLKQQFHILEVLVSYITFYKIVHNALNIKKIPARLVLNQTQFEKHCIRPVFNQTLTVKIYWPRGNQCHFDICVFCSFSVFNPSAISRNGTMSDMVRVLGSLLSLALIMRQEIGPRLNSLSPEERNSKTVGTP